MLRPLLCTLWVQHALRSAGYMWQATEEANAGGAGVQGAIRGADLNNMGGKAGQGRGGTGSGESGQSGSGCDDCSTVPEGSCSGRARGAAPGATAGTTAGATTTATAGAIFPPSPRWAACAGLLLETWSCSSSRSFMALEPRRCNSHCSRCRDRVGLQGVAPGCSRL